MLALLPPHTDVRAPFEIDTFPALLGRLLREWCAGGPPAARVRGRRAFYGAELFPLITFPPVVLTDGAERFKQMQVPAASHFMRFFVRSAGRTNTHSNRSNKAQGLGARCSYARTDVCLCASICLLF